MPRPATNVPVPATDPIFEGDCVYYDLGLVVEADGPQHQDGVQRMLDIERDAELAALGIDVVRFTHDELEHAPWLVAVRLRRWIELVHARPGGAAEAAASWATPPVDP